MLDALPLVTGTNGATYGCGAAACATDKEAEWMRELATPSQSGGAAEYDAAGPPGARTIVFVHASGWTRAMWLPQMRALAERYRVVAIDLPGHGSLAGERFSLDTAVARIGNAIRHESDTPVLLVGLSLGGFLAMIYAHRHPDLLAGLALAGCSVSFTGRIGLLTRLSALVFRLIWRRPLLERMKRRQRRDVRTRYPAPLAEALIRSGFYPRSWGRALGQAARVNYRRIGRDFPRPVLILNGEHDEYNRAAETAHAATMRDARIRVIQGAGHICNLDAPEQFTGILRDFADSLSWGA